MKLRIVQVFERNGPFIDFACLILEFRVQSYRVPLPIIYIYHQSMHLIAGPLEFLVVFSSSRELYNRVG